MNRHLPIRCGYFYIAALPVWRWMFGRYPHRRIGLFKNLPGVRPGRWGFYVFGFEFGSRNPGDPVGLWLKSHGLYPW